MNHSRFYLLCLLVSSVCWVGGGVLIWFGSPLEQTEQIIQFVFGIAFLIVGCCVACVFYPGTSSGFCKGPLSAEPSQKASDWSPPPDWIP